MNLIRKDVKNLMVMAYRSDVKILCGEKAFEMLNESFKKNDFYPDEILKSDNNEYLISFYSERWYDHFFHILTKFLKNLMNLIQTITMKDMNTNF